MGWGRGWGSEWGWHRGWGYMMNSPPAWWNWRYLYAAIPMAALIAWWITRCIRGLVWLIALAKSLIQNLVGI